jgi:hypothetical protein
LPDVTKLILVDSGGVSEEGRERRLGKVSSITRDLKKK